MNEIMPAMGYLGE